jgi:hypothetical protein
MITERRRQALCPVCGERIRLVGNTTDGRYIGSCGDAFSARQWRTLGPRTTNPHIQSNSHRRHHERVRIKLLLIGEFEVKSNHPLVRAAARLDAFREAVQPAAEYGLTLYEATAGDLAHCGVCSHAHAQHLADGGSCAVAGCSCEQFSVCPPDTPGAPE